jgi:ankyrin repeat protein
MNDKLLLNVALKCSLRRYIAAGEAADFETSRGDTALLNAARIGNMEILKLLVAEGATIDYENRLGHTVGRCRLTQIYPRLIVLRFSACSQNMMNRFQTSLSISTRAAITWR